MTGSLRGDDASVYLRGPREGRMAQQKARPIVRFLVALLVVVALALIAVFVGYLIGDDLAGVTAPAFRVLV